MHNLQYLIVDVKREGDRGEKEPHNRTNMTLTQFLIYDVVWRDCVLNIMCVINKQFIDWILKHLFIIYLFIYCCLFSFSFITGEWVSFLCNPFACCAFPFAVSHLLFLYTRIILTLLGCLVHRIVATNQGSSVWPATVESDRRRTFVLLTLHFSSLTNERMLLFDLRLIVWYECLKCFCD